MSSASEDPVPSCARFRGHIPCSRTKGKRPSPVAVEGTPLGSPLRSQRGIYAFSPCVGNHLSINSPKNEENIILPITIRYSGAPISTFALVDSGASSSFIDITFAQSNSISLRLKATPRDLEVVDGRPISSGAITHETIPVQLEIGSHAEDIQFDVTSLGHYPVILGMPWLTLHDPVISWSQRRVVFGSDYCGKHCLQQSPAVQSLPSRPTRSNTPAIGAPSPMPASQPQPQPNPNMPA